MLRAQRLIYLIGVVFVVGGIAHAGLKIADEGAVVAALINLTLLGATGSTFLYVGSQLSSMNIHPQQYPRIIGWCLGGVGVMLLFLVLRGLHPTVTAEFALGTRVIALAIGSVAGLTLGLHEAAMVRKREIEGRNEELERTRTRLEARNEELERTRAELQEAVQKLEASNERLDRFASTAAHDLQEPLRMVSSYLDLIERRYDDELDEDGEVFISYAVDGADRMQTMIDDLLVYSRVETRGDPFEPVALDEVLEDVLADLQVKIDEQAARISADTLPQVRGDPSQLRQLFQNLLSNAIEYSEDAPQVDISVQDRGEECVISVRDDGVGIDPDDQERIFELFQRLHGIDEHAGTGIGLALCRRIVERHGGTIWVDSEPGEGSTFSFTIPVADEHRRRPMPA